jgi:YggT family protein
VTASTLYNVIGFVATALYVLIVARIAVSWIGLSPWHPVVKWLRIIVDPILAPFRRILPSFGGIDFSPILAIVIIYFVADILQTLVLGGGIDPANTAVGLIGQLVGDIAIAIAVLVFVRLLLSLFHADPWHPLVQMVRTMTNPLVAPFAGLRRGHGAASFDYPAVAALVLYVALIFVIRILFGFLLSSV